MDKQFLTLLAATTTRVEALNEVWSRVIAYAVKKVHSDKENGTTYVQAALDTAPAGVRRGVASAFRQLNVIVESAERGQFVAGGVRAPKKQEAVFARIKDGDIPDVVQMADRLPKAKKADTRAAAEIAADAIKRMLDRLKADNPDAFAVANDRLSRVELQAKPNTLTVGRDEAALSNIEADKLAAHLVAIREGTDERVLPKEALLIGGEVVELTAEESDAMFRYMQDALRSRALKAA